MILDDIVAATKERVKREKEEYPMDERLIESIEKSPISLEKAMREVPFAFLCEVKKASPSKGIIADDFPYVEIAKEYERAGATGISVLTEPAYFLGDMKHLIEIKKEVTIPVLRKDFIIDTYQIYQSKFIGADAILLIVSILGKEKLQEFYQIATGLGLSVLVEAHTKEEIEFAVSIGAKIIGVNNRNLKDFTMNLKNSITLRQEVPEDRIFLSESGVSCKEDIRTLMECGVNGALIGEYMMKAKDKVETLRELKCYGR